MCKTPKVRWQEVWYTLREVQEVWKAELEEGREEP